MCAGKTCQGNGNSTERHSKGVVYYLNEISCLNIRLPRLRNVGTISRDYIIISQRDYKVYMMYHMMRIMDTHVIFVPLQT